MEEQQTSNKRRRSRIKGLLYGSYVLGGKKISGNIINFSEFGFFMTTKFLPEIGSDVNFWIHLDENKKFPLVGRIVHHFPTETTPSKAQGMGVEIVKGPPDYLFYLEELRSLLITS